MFWRGGVSVRTWWTINTVWLDIYKQGTIKEAALTLKGIHSNQRPYGVHGIGHSCSDSVTKSQIRCLQRCLKITCMLFTAAPFSLNCWDESVYTINHERENLTSKTEKCNSRVFHVHLTCSNISWRPQMKIQCMHSSIIRVIHGCCNTNTYFSKPLKYSLRLQDFLSVNSISFDTRWWTNW